MSPSRLFAMFLGVVALAAPRAPAADLPPDLNAVPADAAAFVHIRVGDALRSDQLKTFREMIHRAGPIAVEAFSRRFAPDPLTLDRLTVAALPPAPDGPPEEPIVIFRMSKPFDPAALKKSLVPGGTEVTIGGARFVRDEGKDVALRVIDNQTFLVCPPRAAARAAAAPKRDGPLAPALARAAAGSHVVVAGVNAAAIPSQTLAQVPPPFAPLAQAKLATLTLELAAEPKVELRLRYADDQSAAAAEQTARGLVQMAQGGLTMFRGEMERRVAGTDQPGTLEELPEAFGSLLALGGVNQVEQFLKDLPLRRDGTDLSLAVAVPQALQANFGASNAVLIGMLLPAVQKVREAAARTKGQNNLKQIALAMHNYHDAYTRLPAHAIYSKDGKTPLLSWRVAILPFIEQDALYKQFKLDEPWDSEHNKKLIPLIPPVYVAPGAFPVKEPGLTHYQVFVGPAAGFDRSPRGHQFTDITDGTSNTLMAVETNDPVVWTKPDDIPYDPEKPLPKLTPIHPGGVSAAFFDGSVRFLSTAIDEKVLRAFITIAGGEAIPIP